MVKNYETPEIEIIKLAYEEIINTSGSIPGVDEKEFPIIPW